MKVKVVRMGGCVLRSVGLTNKDVCENPSFCRDFPGSSVRIGSTVCMLSTDGTETLSGGVGKRRLSVRYVSKNESISIMELVLCV